MGAEGTVLPFQLYSFIVFLDSEVGINNKEYRTSTSRGLRLKNEMV